MQMDNKRYPEHLDARHVAGYDARDAFLADLKAKQYKSLLGLSAGEITEIFADQPNLEDHTKMDNKRRGILDKLRPDVQLHFSVPIGELSELKLNENLACFLIFLLQILDDEAHSFSDNQASLYGLLQKKLSFLHAFLGDTPFQCIELEDTITLLTEFRVVANEAGSFIYSCLSISSDEIRSKNFDTGIQGLLEKVDTFMNVSIKEHCIKELPKSLTSRTNHPSSFFIIGSLLEDLQGLLDGQFDLNLDDDIRVQFNILIKELTFFLAFSNDVEKSQVIHTNDELDDSFIQFIDATYEAEYLINAHTAGHIPSWYLNLRIPYVIRKIQIISTSVQNIKIHSVKDVKVQALKHPEQDASIVVGFENIREPILADLVGGSTALKYISIFGMSGIGKSTMANKLYNERVVHDYFDLHVWCTVSKTYEKKKVLDEIWMSLPRKSGHDETSNYENLALRIYQTLIGRKYLIIMDDVWDSRMWDDLRKCFPDVRNGSRILLTSQMKDSAPHGCIFHQLPLLSNSQSYNLLTKKIFVKEHIPSQLLDITQKIAAKCNGLPLTVIVVAGILTNVGREESVWRNVERNMDLYKSDDSSMRILELSYEYLPTRLKPCFLSMWWSFPSKDIRVRYMIPLWISHGYVEKEENRSKEEIAGEYLLELINRSLLIITKRRSDGGIKVCEVHDLIADMCLRRARKEKMFGIIGKCRSSFNYMEHPHINLPLEPTNICHISALPCRSVKRFISTLGHSVTKMPSLRVIAFQESPIDEKSIGGLVHLRYFHSIVGITQVPEGIWKLVNLEYLHIDTSYKVDVPSTILKMVKLRGIRIASQVIFYVNCDISQIRNNIKALSRVRIRNHDDEDMLKCSPHLRKLKCICEGLLPDLSSHALLESLNMSVFNNPRLEGGLTKMNIPLTLKNVTLSGTKLPWEEISVIGKLPNLQVLKLLYDAFCGKEWETRDYEFQKLKFLKIRNILSLRQWTSCSEHFPKLQHLLLDNVRVGIPQDFGNIASLETIEVGDNCGNEVYESVELIREEQLEYENEDLKIITREKGKKEEEGEEEGEGEGEEEVIGKSNDGSSNLLETSAARSHEPEASTQTRICAGCNSNHASNFTFSMGSLWHEECFCCHACKEPIFDLKFRQDSNGPPYHDSCFQGVRHPKCYVCKDFVRENADGNYDYRVNKFWDLTYCESHLTDGTPHCCSCQRFESLDVAHSILDDGRALCLECSKSSIIRNAEECQPLYIKIQDYMKGLNIKMFESCPVLLINSQAMYAISKEYEESDLDWEVYEVDGSELIKRVVINSILVLDNLPRMLTGYYIVVEMINTWILLEGFHDLDLKVKAGISLVLYHMWLEHEIVSRSSEKGKRSEFEIKLGEYKKNGIENDYRSNFRDGFREAKKAVDKYGLEPTLNHIRRTGTFPK